MKTFRHRTQKLGHFHSASAIRHTGQFCPLAVRTGFSVPRDEVREGSPPSGPSLKQQVVSVLCFPAVRDARVFLGRAECPSQLGACFCLCWKPALLGPRACARVRVGHRRMAGQCPGPHLPRLFVDSLAHSQRPRGWTRLMVCTLELSSGSQKEDPLSRRLKNKNPSEEVPVPHLPCLLWPLRTDEFSEGPESGCWAVGQVSPGPAAAKAKEQPDGDLPLRPRVPGLATFALPCLLVTGVTRPFESKS